MIEIENLTKYYGNFKALDDVSFTVHEREVLGFLGPNGAGKTTTLRILTSFIPPSSGTIRVAGTEIIDNPIKTRSRIGYLPENTPLYLDLTVEEHLEYMARLRGINSKNIPKEISRVTQTCALEEVFYKPVSILSKGFKQRLGLAITLLHQPDILVLDEPTSGLDPRQILDIRTLIKSIGKEKTVILSSHILPEVAATCDRVVIIHKGKIVGKGTPDELQSSRGKEGTLITTIRGEYEDVRSTIEGLDFIRSIKSETKIDENKFHYEIKISDEPDADEKFFCVIRDKGFIISELYLKHKTLEDVFLSLTTEETGEVS